MSSEFGDKLIAALEENRTNVNNFIWKGPKVKQGDSFVQEQIHLVDASDQQLKNFYKHCKTMLLNEDHKIPGRIPLLRQIEDQRNRCGVELFYKDSDKKASRFSIVDSLRVYTSKLPSADSDSIMLGDVVTTHADFTNLPVKLVIDGGLDKLGRFDRSHITLTFILKQGLWFTKEEAVSFAESFEPNFNKFDKLRVIREKLGLPKDAKVYFNPQGLSYSQLKSVLSLRSKKYSDLSMEQLKTLRNKLLFALEDEVNMHIMQWNDRIFQLETVARLRELSLG